METMINYLNQIIKIYDQLWKELSVFSNIQKIITKQTGYFSTITETEFGSFCFRIEYFILNLNVKKFCFYIDIRFNPVNKNSPIYSASFSSKNYLISKINDVFYQQKIVKELLKTYVSYYRSAVYSGSNF